GGSPRMVGSLVGCLSCFVFDGTCDVAGAPHSSKRLASGSLWAIARHLGCTHRSDRRSVPGEDAEPVPSRCTRFSINDVGGPGHFLSSSKEAERHPAGGICCVERFLCSGAYQSCLASGGNNSGDGALRDFRYGSPFPQTYRSAAQAHRYQCCNCAVGGSMSSFPL